jgi:methanogenic corrinoid protein MtbC1
MKIQPQSSSLVFVLDKMIQVNGFSKTIQQVVFPFFERIGILWQAGSVFTAHEHFVSNLVRDRLIRETGKFNCSESAKSGLFFLSENEWHELGLLYARYLAAREGVRTFYLGQSLPFENLASILNSHQFDFVCTTFIQAISKPELEKYLQNLALLFTRAEILVAGRQISIHKPKLPSCIHIVRNSGDFRRHITA